MEHAKADGQGPSSYAPIAQALHTLPEDEQKKFRYKLDIAYFVAIEKMSFLKYRGICELEKHHGVDIGTNYLNESAGRTFIHYIAEAKRQQVVQAVHSAKFFSLLLDGSTDKDNIDKLVLVIWCDTDGNDEKIHTRISYLSVVWPQTTNAQGLFDVVEASSHKEEVQE